MPPNVGIDLSLAAVSFVSPCSQDTSLLPQQYKLQLKQNIHFSLETVKSRHDPSINKPQSMAP